MKRPVSMPCTEEQAKEMKKLCEKQGFKIELDYLDGWVLVNNCDGVMNIISFLHSDYSKEHYRTEIPYNPIEFIKACGVEVEHPKWEKLTRGGFEYHIYDEFEGNIFGRVYNHERWISVEWNNKGERADFVNSPYNLIPYNPRKDELLTKKA